MSKFKKTNKLPMEDILVVGATAAMHKTGNNIVSGTNYTIANGEIALLSWDLDSASAPMGEVMAAEDATVYAYKVVQGTPKSQALNTVDPWEVGDKGLVSSGIIRTDAVRSLTVELPETHKNSAYVLSGITAPVAGEEYRVYIKTESIRNDRDWGGNDDTIHANYLTPDLTGVTSPTDLVLQNLAYKINTQSKLFGGNRQVIALGIDTDGSGAGTNLAAVTCGTVLDVVTIDGNTYTVTVDEGMMKALYEITVAAGSAITSASDVIVIDPTTAGAAANVDALLFLGLAHDKAAYFDNIPFVMTDITVNPAAAFVATGNSFTGVKYQGSEGRGQGWRWAIEYDNRARLNVHTMQNRPFKEEYSQGVSYINPDAYYTSYIVEYYDWEETLTTREQSPKTLIILFPSTIACADIDGITPVAPAVTITDGGTLKTDVAGILTDQLQLSSGLVVKNSNPASGLI